MNQTILKKMKGALRFLFGRTTFGALFLALQILFLLSAFDWLKEYMVVLFGGSAALSVAVLIYIISDEENSSIKLSWVVPILVIPVFGTLFYLFLKMQPGTWLINRRIGELQEETAPLLSQDPETEESYNRLNAGGGNLVRYMNRYGRYPIYSGTEAKYFPLGDDFFPALLEELKRRKYSFLWNILLWSGA